MSGATRLDHPTVDDILDRIEARIDELIDEHERLPGNWLGGPRRRYHEIMGAVRELKALHRTVAEIDRRLVCRR